MGSLHRAALEGDIGKVQHELQALQGARDPADGGAGSGGDSSSARPDAARRGVNAMAILGDAYCTVLQVAAQSGDAWPS